VAERKIKFKISVKELAVEFEGDILTAERIQQQVTGALNNLATAPNRLLDTGRPQPAADIIDVQPRRRRRRRSRSSAAETSAEGAVIDLESTPSPTGESQKSVRRSSDGATALITGLAEGSFFTERKTVGQIREQLSRKGHSFSTSELTPALARLTRDGVLERDKQNNQWVYFVQP
jgi:hypothetical protein